jgi:hypothetical protein
LKKYLILFRIIIPINSMNSCLGTLLFNPRLR